MWVLRRECGYRYQSRQHREHRGVFAFLLGTSELRPRIIRRSRCTTEASLNGLDRTLEQSPYGMCISTQGCSAIHAQVDIRVWLRTESGYPEWRGTNAEVHQSKWYSWTVFNPNSEMVRTCNFEINRTHTSIVFRPEVAIPSLVAGSVCTFSSYWEKTRFELLIVAYSSHNILP